MGVVTEYRYVLLSKPCGSAVPAIVPGTFQWLETLMREGIKLSRTHPDVTWFIEKRQKDAPKEVVRVYKAGADTTTEYKSGSRTD
jgi:hypothetical protein